MYNVSAGLRLVEAALGRACSASGRPCNYGGWLFGACVTGAVGGNAEPVFNETGTVYTRWAGMVCGGTRSMGLAAPRTGRKELQVKTQSFKNIQQHKGE